MENGNIEDVNARWQGTAVPEIDSNRPLSAWYSSMARFNNVASGLNRLDVRSLEDFPAMAEMYGATLKLLEMEYTRMNPSKDKTQLLKLVNLEIGRLEMCIDQYMRIIETQGT